MRCLDERTLLQKGTGREGTHCEPHRRNLLAGASALSDRYPWGEHQDAPPQRHPKCASEKKSNLRGTSD